MAVTRASAGRARKNRTWLTRICPLHVSFPRQGLGHLLSIGHLLSDRSNDLLLLSSLRRLMVRELQVLLDSVEGVIDLAGEMVPEDEQDTQAVHVRSGVNQRVRTGIGVDSIS